MADEQLYTPDADNQVFGDPGKPGNLQSLYDKLHGADLYTKSFDEFKKKYSDTQNIDALYNKLNSAEYFRKSKDDFYQKYFPDQHIERKVDQHFNIADARAQMLAKTQPLPDAPTASAPPVTPDNTPMEPGSPFPKAYQNNIVYPDQNKLIGEIDAAKKTITEKLNDQKALNQFIRGQQTSQIQNIRHMAEDGQITPEQANQQIYRLDVNKDYADKKQSIVNNMRPYLHSADDPKIKKAMYVLDAANRLKNDPNSGQKAAKVLANAKQIENGDLDLTPTGRLVQPLGFWDSLLHGWNQKNKAFDDYDFFSTKPDKEVIEELEKRRKEYDAETPIKMPQGAGVISSTIGAMPIKSLVAEGITAAIPGAEELAPAVGAAVGSGDFYRMSKATAIPDIYNDLRGKGVAPEQALSQAREVATKQALIDAAQGAVTAGIGGRLGRASKNAALSFSDVMGSRALEVAGVAGSAGSAQALKNAIAGRDTDIGIGEAMATQAGMAAAIGAAVLVGKGIQVKASRPLLYHVTKDIPPEALQGHIDEMLTNGQITTDQANTAKVAINKQYQDNAKILASVPEEKVPAIQEKIEQRDNLKKLLDNSHESFHPAIKAQIAALDADIVAQAMGQPSPSLLDKAKTEIQKGNTKGFTKSILEHSADDPDALRGILKEIAEQAHDPRSAATTEDTYGKPLVDIAKELHPIENFPKQEALLTHPEPADQSGVDQTAPSASVNQGPLESRHANTPNDDAGKISGTTAETLSKEGEQEAQKLAADAKEKAVNKIITSDLNRNQQTAQIVSGQTGATIETNPNLKTWDIGEFDSMPDEEFKRVKAWFVTHPDKKEYDGQRVNESFNQYKDRIIAAQLALENEPPTTLVINNSNNMGVWDAYIKNGRQWNEQAAKDYLTAKKPEPATLTTKITSDATTEQKTNEMDVRQQTGDGETMGSGDARPSESAQSSTSGPDDTGPQEKNKNTGQEGEAVNNPELTGITHAQMDQTARELGLDTYEKSPETIEQWDQQARERMAANPDSMNILFNKLRNDGRPDKVETRMMIMYMADLKAKYNENQTPYLLNTIKRAKDIFNIIGREQGKELRARQGAIPVEETLSDFHLRDIEYNKNAPLTENQTAQSTKEFYEISKAKKSYEEKVAELEAKNAKLKAQSVVSKTVEAKSSTKRTHADYVNERKDIYASIKEKLKKARGETSITVVPYAKELIAISPDVAKLVKSFVGEGIDKLDDIVKNVHSILKEDLPDITENNIHNIIAGEYTQPKKTRSETAEKLHDLKTEAKLINKLESLQNNEPKTEKQKIRRNQRIEELRQQIKSLKNEEKDANKFYGENDSAERKIERMEDELQRLKERREKIKEPKEKNEISEREQKLKDEIAKERKEWNREKAEANKFYGENDSAERKILQSIKKKTENQIKELQDQLNKGEFAPEAPKEPFLNNPELKRNFPNLYKDVIEAKDRLVKLKQEREVRLLKQKYENRDILSKVGDAAANILNAPRSIMSSMDYSAPLRQGLVASVAHPTIAAKAMAKMFKFSASENNFNKWFIDLKESADYHIMRESGLSLTDPHDPVLSAHEEAFMSHLPEKIPGIGRLIKGSERAYTGFLNKIRVDCFRRLTDAFNTDGKTFINSPELYKAAADYVNATTGRGSLPEFLEKSSPLLNALFFSPRLIASRIQLLTNPINPKFYLRVPKEIRVEYFKDMAKFIGAGVTILALAKLGGASVETDPRSSDFGKIRVGNTRWDIWGGFQQYVRVFTQIASGQKKNPNSGEVKKLDGTRAFGETTLDVAGRFVRSKLAPVPGSVLDLWKGRDVTGQKVTLTSEAQKTLLPLIYSDISQAMQDQGVKALFTVGVPATFGVGVQTYNNTGASSGGAGATGRYRPQNK